MERCQEELKEEEIDGHLRSLFIYLFMVVFKQEVKAALGN